MRGTRRMAALGDRAPRLQEVAERVLRVHLTLASDREAGGRAGAACGRAATGGRPRDGEDRGD